MRIIQLRFGNLNSLTGEWSIDFSHPTYTQEGLFAIIGPTGAGKSTLLDALCLGLYGRTPRLGKITQSANEIMSRHTGTCFAEVVFWLPQGSYRCFWSQHRARKKAESDLQAPKHEVSRISDGYILESRLSCVDKVVEELTGMDFERFTRSVLLAQGAFAAFLHAPPQDRAPLLESLTGTDIYGNLSCYVHQKKREETDILMQLEDKLKSIQVKEPEEEEKLYIQIQEYSSNEERLNKSLEEIQGYISFRHLYNSQKQELAQLENQKTLLQSEIDSFAPHKHKLELGVRALKLNSIYIPVLKALLERKSIQEDCQRWQNNIQELESKYTLEKQRSDEAKSQMDLLSQQHVTLLQLWPQVRSIDKSLLKLKSNLESKQNKYLECQVSHKTQNVLMVQIEEKILAHQKKLEQIQLYQVNNSADKILLEEYSAIEQRVEELQKRESEFANLKKESEQNKNKYSALQEETVNLHNNLKLSQKNLEEANNRLNTLQNNYAQLLKGQTLQQLRAERDQLYRDIMLQRQYLSLEELRGQLQQGCACPLCGSHQHPFAAGQDWQQPELELQSKQRDEQLEALERLHKKIEDEKESMRTSQLEFGKIEHSLGLYNEKLSNAQLTMKNSLNELEKHTEKFKTRVDSLFQKLSPLGVTRESPELADSTGAAFQDLLKNLGRRKNIWSRSLEEKSKHETGLHNENLQLAQLKGKITALGDQLPSLEAEVLQAKNHIQDLSQERFLLFGTRDPQQEEEDFKKSLYTHQNQVTEQEKVTDQLRLDLTRQNTILEQLNKNLKVVELEYTEAESLFSLKLFSEGWENLDSFRAALISEEEIQQLEERASLLSERESKLNHSHAALLQKLEKVEAEHSFIRTLEELQDNKSQCEKQLRVCIEEKTLAQKALEDQRLIKVEQQKIGSQVGVQKKQLHRWMRLHDLIGSADGNKFRNFAQGITFEVLLSYANKQLQKLTDRYLLTRDEKSALELRVLDLYQAGVLRSVKNLSGGESFLVSLALALGLSGMSSQKVRIDSLFLDEGFGTLDELALNAALETLAGLRSEGKIIGVISHVKTLRERISAQIRVIPQNGGRSRIEGPGCSNLN